MKFFSGVIDRPWHAVFVKLQRSHPNLEWLPINHLLCHRSVFCQSLRNFSSQVCIPNQSKKLSRKSTSNPHHCTSHKSFKHSGPHKVQTKEGDVRNYASSVIDAKPILERPADIPGSVEGGDWKSVGLNDSLRPYLTLAKFRLTCFVAMSSMAGYAVAPGAFDLTSLLSCTAGVLLTSSSANAVNQFFEVPYDSQMARTMNRPIVKGQITPQRAVAFAAASGSTGLLVLYLGANPLTAALGLTTFLVYTCWYTPMKRTNVANTWVGSIVGAIPPMMGWAAATGHLDVGAWLMGGVLFAWQFPHFCALSWNLRSDYSRAGYRMMSVVDPGLCQRVSLRYTLGLAGLSVLFPLCGVTGWTATAALLPLNAWLAHLARRFYVDGDGVSSRKLFKFSLVYLPLALILLIAGKKRERREGEEEEEVEVEEGTQALDGVVTDGVRGDELD